MLRRSGALALATVLLVALSPGRPAATAAPVSTVDTLLARMTLSQQIGQLFMFSFDGPTAGPAVLRMVREWGVGGLILYRPNVVSGAQVRALTGAVQHAAHIPLLIATDEEGGAIAMVPFWTGVHPLLSARDYGVVGSPGRVYRDALAAGRDLRSLGITMNLAPVLDVLLNPSSPIGARSYGPGPRAVAALGVAAIRGYQAAGIAATAKHFLGLGGVGIDAHKGLPTVTRTLRQLEAAELVPFRAAIAAGVDALMVTHAVIPALDPMASASLSRPVITGFVRHTLGYSGLIISDSLMMGAIEDRLSIGEAAVQAAAAGSDIVLISYYQHRDPAILRGAMEAVAHAVATGRITRQQVAAAARHVLALKAKLGLLPGRSGHG